MLQMDARRPLGYDDFWHVFYAAQDSWSGFWRELSDDAHPPLYYLLLRASYRLLPHGSLWYRVLSILAMTASTLLVARLTWWCTRNAWLAVVCAAAFGWSSNSLEMATDVRSYAQYLAFSLVATLAWMQWLERPGRRMRPRVLFAVAASLAVLSHYIAFILLAAMIATPIALALVHGRWRRRLLMDARVHPVALAAMFGVPVVIAVVPYLAHARHWANGLSHLHEFFYDRSKGSPIAWTGMSLVRLAELFTPTFGNQLPDPGWTALVFLAVLCVLALMMRRVRRSIAVAPFALLAILVALNAVGGLAGRYPFGGALRHEIFLYPYVVVCFFVAVELLRRSGPRPLRAAGWTAALFFFVIWNQAATLSRHTFDGTLAQGEMEDFHRIAPAPEAVLVEQFNLVLFFAHYHQWTWHRVWNGPHDAVWQVYEVTRGSDKILLCRGATWLYAPAEPGLYSDLKNCLDRTGASSVALLHSHQGGMPVALSPARMEMIAPILARDAGLTVDKLVASSAGVQASFRR